MRTRDLFLTVVAAAAVASGTTWAMAAVAPAAVAVAMGTGTSLLVTAAVRWLVPPAAPESGAVPLANISHEIRTPLNGILGLTQLLMRMQPSTQQREYLEAIKSSGQSLRRLINDILDYSKMRSGALKFESETFSLRKRVRETVRALAPQAHLAGLELAFWIEPDVPNDVVGDPSRLRQVLANLLVNAIQYTRSGDIALAVSQEWCEGSSAVLCFSVSDTGVGVPEPQRGSIFEAFSRGTETAHANVEDGGVGLGLAIAKELVERMGGEISVDASPSGGSTFRFTARFELPPDGASGDDTTPEEAPSGTRRSRCRR